MDGSDSKEKEGFSGTGDFWFPTGKNKEDEDEDEDENEDEKEKDDEDEETELGKLRVGVEFEVELGSSKIEDFVKVMRIKFLYFLILCSLLVI